MLNPLPPKSASFSCHVEYVEYVESFGTYPPPPKKNKNNNITVAQCESKVSFFGWVGGGQTKKRLFQLSCWICWICWTPPPLKMCFFLLSCWICWICWIILELIPPPPPKKIKRAPHSSQNIQHIQHIQHDSWKKHFFLEGDSTWFNIFNMTAERTTFWTGHSEIPEKLFEIATLPPPPPPKNVLIVPKTFNIFNIFNMTAERSIFLGGGFNMIQHIQHDSWKEHFFS